MRAVALILRAWRTVCLSISMRCQIFDSPEAIYFAHIACRNTQTALHDAVGRSVMQKIFEVVIWAREFQEIHGRKDNQALAKLWNEKSRENALETKLVEAVDAAWMETAQKVHKRLLDDPACLRVIMRFDLKFSKDSCLNYMETLDALCSKGGSSDYVWFLNTMWDLISIGQANNRDFSARHLASTKAGSSRFLQLWLAKKGLLDHLMRWLMEAEVQLLQGLSNHESFREKVGGAGDRVDLSWQATLSEGSRKAITFMEAAGC